MYQALYRKYRPSTFSEVVGQEHITETLKNQLAQNRIFHAYLFTGTRGTGKTSCAKILAKSVNCLSQKNGDPCCECASCREIAAGEVMDIAEIDAASNNSVEDIRTLREQVNFTPAKAKYRVYIIDEVHMLTQSAFNALLKTLEEPPSHVIFILATTEIHKLPATIISRCERFDFKRIDSADIAKRLEFVCTKENIKANNSAIKLISLLADGGMRDALSILDLCAATGKVIDEDVVSSVCGLSGRERMFKAADAILRKDAAAAVATVEEVHISSAGVSRFLADLSSHFRDLLIIKTVKDNRPVTATAEELKKLEIQAEGFTTEQLLYILDILRSSLSVSGGADPRTLTEMTVIRLCLPETVNTFEALESRISALEKAVASGVAAGNRAENRAAEVPNANDAEVPPAKSEKITEEYSETDIPPEEDVPQAEVMTQPAQKQEEPDIGETLFGGWASVLEKIKTTCPAIAGVLADSRAYIRNDMLLIDSNNPMFRKLLGNNPLYRTRIKEAAADITGRQFRLGPYERKISKKEEAADPLLALSKKLDSLSNEIK